MSSLLLDNITYFVLFLALCAAGVFPVQQINGEELHR